MCSSFIGAVEPVVVNVDCGRLHYVLYRTLDLLRQLNPLLKLLIVVGYMCSREL